MGPRARMCLSAIAMSWTDAVAVLEHPTDACEQFGNTSRRRSDTSWELFVRILVYVWRPMRSAGQLMLLLTCKRTFLVHKQTRPTHWYVSSFFTPSWYTDDKLLWYCAQAFNYVIISTFIQAITSAAALSMTQRVITLARCGNGWGYCWIVKPLMPINADTIHASLSLIQERFRLLEIVHWAGWKSALTGTWNSMVQEAFLCGSCSMGC